MYINTEIRHSVNIGLTFNSWLMLPLHVESPILVESNHLSFHDEIGNFAPLLHIAIPFELTTPNMEAAVGLGSNPYSNTSVH